jgi:hypothetical protein
MWQNGSMADTSKVAGDGWCRQNCRVNPRNARIRILLVALIFLPRVANAQRGGSLFDFDPEKVDQPAPKQPAPQRYPLDADHGPVMVRVASFVGAEAAAAADALAHELRRSHKIEAYTYRHQLSVTPALSKEEIEAFQEKFGVKPRVMKVRTPPPENWVVLAGSFDSFDGRAAQSLLQKIRKLNPQSIDNSIQPTSMPSEVQIENRLFRRKSATPSPLAGAMLVANPLLPPGKVPTISSAHRRMLLELNDDEPYSVYRNPSPFTILVVRFYGASGVLDEKAKKDHKEFSLLAKKTSPRLEKAAANAVVITDLLRKMGFDAYVFHGKYGSIVCVGGYESPNDPRLRDDLRKLATTKVGPFSLQPELIPTPKRPNE